MNALAFDRFSFDKPDKDFEIIEDGYQCLLKRAKIKYLIFPGRYNSIIKQYKEVRSTKESLVVDTLTLKIQMKEAYTLVQEEVAPADGNYEHYIMVTIILPYTDNLSFGIIGLYPKIFDSDLRSKFIKAGLTIMKD